MNVATAPQLETHYLAFAALVLMGLLLSAVLAPRATELALIYFKTDRLEEAAQIYEKLYAQGERGTAVAIPLGRIYQRMGRADESIRVLEDFAEQHPDNPEVLALLAEAYQSDQRDYHHLETLQRLAELEPTPDRLRDLSHLLNYHGEHQAQIQVLKKLVQLEPGVGQNYMDLAQMQASLGQLGQASATLTEMFKVLKPDQINDQYVRFQVRLMLANGAYEDALLWAQDAVQSFAQQADKARAAILNDYVRLFLQRGLKKQALALLQGQRAVLAGHPELLSQYVELLIETGQKERAFAELQTLRKQATLSDNLRGSLVDLALGQKLLDLAVDVAARIKPERMPEWMKVALLESALERAQKTGDGALLARVESQADTAFLFDHPLLAARLALYHHRHEALVLWLDRAAERQDLSVQQRVTLAEMYLLAGEAAKAQIHLRRLADKAGVSGELIAQLAPMYLQAGEIEEGLRFFETLRQSNEAPEIQFAWALMASAAGRFDQIQIWLQDEAPPVPAKTMSDLFYAAADRGHHRLALLLARQIQQDSPGQEARILLANALLAEGSKGNALEVLTLLKQDQQNAEARQIRQNALFKAWEEGAGEDRAEVKQEMLDYWDRELARPDLPNQQRRQIAHQLLELGEKPRAETQFRRLARRAGPKSGDVRQLLFLWGPAIKSADLDWLEQRAAASSAKDQEDWYQILQNLGQEQRVSRLIQSQPRSERAAQSRERLLQVLANRAYADPDEMPALDKELKAQIEETSSVTRLEKLATFARSQDRGDVERQAWEKVLSLDPEHKLALRSVGLAAYVAEDMQTAQAYLERYNSLYDPDWETRYFLGEALVGQGLIQQASYEFEAAFDLLEDLAATQPLNKFQRVAHAQILFRDGRLGRALEEYAALYADFPEDADLRADYAGMLIEQGEMNRAMQVLGGRP